MYLSNSPVAAGDSDDYLGRKCYTSPCLGKGTLIRMCETDVNREPRCFVCDGEAVFGDLCRVPLNTKKVQC